MTYNAQGYKLFLDDERMPSGVDWVDLPTRVDGHWVIVRDFWEFKEVIRERGIPEFVSFDYVLINSPNPRARESRFTGKDCAEYLAMCCMREDRPFPPHTIHTSDPEFARKIAEVISYLE